jgi:hypothetical protein
MGELKPCWLNYVLFIGVIMLKTILECKLGLGVLGAWQTSFPCLIR